MPYIATKPNNAYDPELLRKAIPGWGVDKDPAMRPAVPREQFVPRPAAGTGGLLPERQAELVPRERSTEHGMLPPVFGTTVPLKGLSGIIKRFAYKRYSEGQSAHWLLLVLGDRIDVFESMISSALRLRPDRPIKEMGLRSEITGHPIASRFGQHRADLVHQPVDWLVFAGKFALAGLAIAGVTHLITKQRA